MRLLSNLLPRSVKLREGCQQREQNFGWAIVAQGYAKPRPDDQPSLNSTTSLHEATESGDIERVKQLLKNGADVTATNNYGQSVLRVAKEFGFIDIGLLLLENNAEINLRDDAGRTPLHMASERGLPSQPGYSVKDETISFLLARGAEIDCQDKRGYTPLICTVRDSHEMNVR